jgi:hypothetical protein
MGFHKRQLPEIEKLKELHQVIGNDLEFIQKVCGKAEVFDGSSESINYIEEVSKRAFGKKPDVDWKKRCEDLEKELEQVYTGWQKWGDIFIQWSKSQIDSKTIDGLQEFLGRRYYPPKPRE